MVHFLEAVMLFFFLMCGISLLLTANLLFAPKGLSKDFLVILFSGEILVAGVMAFWTYKTRVLAALVDSELVFAEMLLFLTGMLWLITVSLTVKLYLESKHTKVHDGLYVGVFLFMVLCSIVTPFIFYNAV